MLRVEQVMVGSFVIEKDNAMEVTTKAWEDVVHFLQSFKECWNDSNQETRLENMDICVDFLPIVETIKNCSKQVECYAIVKKIRSQLPLLKEVRVRHTFRDTNSCGDKLAKAGIMCAQDMEFQDDISEFILDLSQNDNDGVMLHSDVGQLFFLLGSGPLFNQK